MAIYNESYDTILDKLLSLARKELPDFTNYSDSDPLVILIKLIAAMTVSSNKYSNKYYRSKFYQDSNKIVDKRSIHQLLKLYDMTPQSIIPGTVTIVFEFTENPTKYTTADEDTEELILKYGDPNFDENTENILVTSQLEIPAGTLFKIGNVVFTNFENSYMNAYNSYITVTLVEGEYKQESFYKSNIKNNRILLSSINISLDYVKLIIDDVEYTRELHAEYSSNLNTFDIEYDMNERYLIVLSDGVISNISEQSNIQVKYIESTGSNDYDPLADQISIISPILYDNVDVSDKLSINLISEYTTSDNTHQLEYNYNRLSRILLTFRKSITVEDYQVLSDYYPGVAITAAYDINSPQASDFDVDIFTDKLLKLYVAPNSGYYMGTSLKNNLYKYFTDIGLDNSELDLVLYDPNYIMINLSIGINLSSEEASDILNIYNDVSTQLKDYFEVGNIKFGQYISGDYILSLILKISDLIQYADILEMSDSEGNVYRSGYQLRATELPILGDLDLRFQYKSISSADNWNISDLGFINVENDKVDTALFKESSILYEKQVYLQIPFYSFSVGSSRMLDGTWQLDGTVQLLNMYEGIPHGIKLWCVAPDNYNTVRGSVVIKRDVWYMDGTYSMNNTKYMDAYYVEEDL